MRNIWFSSSLNSELSLISDLLAGTEIEALACHTKRVLTTELLPGDSSRNGPPEICTRISVISDVD